MLSLIVLQGPGKGRVFRFTGEKPVVLGRQSGDLRLLDNKISRRHAEINFEGGTWIIRDLDSANGTYVNDRRIDQLTELEEGDQLRFGPFVLVVGQLTTDPPTMADTSLVDAESMDHVMLSPHLPTTDRPAEAEDDVMHVEPVSHPPRPDEPPAVAAEQEAAHGSMFDIEADDSQEDSTGLQTPPEEPVSAEAAAAGETSSAAPPEEGGETPYNLIDSVMDSRHELFHSDVAEAHDEPSEPAAADEVESETEVSAVAEDEPAPSEPEQMATEDTLIEQEASSDEDDELHPPRPLGEAKKKPRIIWPVAIAVLLLVLGGAGTTGWWYIAGRPQTSSTPTPTPAPAAARPSAPPSPPSTSIASPPRVTTQPDQSAAAAGSVGAAEPTSEVLEESPWPATAAPTPAASSVGRVDALTMSMLDEGPTLLANPLPVEGDATSAEDEAVEPDRVPEALLEGEPSASAVPVEPLPVDGPVNESQPAETAPPTAEVPAPTAADSIPAAAAVEPVAPHALDSQRVAYLVDASGSLVDTLPQVLTWLDEALRGLDPQLHYTIIFFRAGEAVEVPPAGLKPASDRELLRAVRRWIDWEEANVFPAGRSDPRKAIELALGYRAGQVFILSDGRVGDRLSDEHIADFMVELDALVGDQSLQIHSVQFYYTQVEGLLAHLSRRYPGERRFIEPARPGGDAPPDALDAVRN